MKSIFTSIKKRADEKWDDDAPKKTKRQNILSLLENDFKKIKASKFVKRITGYPGAKQISNKCNDV